MNQSLIPSPRSPKIIVRASSRARAFIALALILAMTGQDFCRVWAGPINSHRARLNPSLPAAAPIPAARPGLNLNPNPADIPISPDLNPGLHPTLPDAPKAPKTPGEKPRPAPVPPTPIPSGSAGKDSRKSLENIFQENLEIWEGARTELELALLDQVGWALFNRDPNVRLGLAEALVRNAPMSLQPEDEIEISKVLSRDRDLNFRPTLEAELSRLIKTSGSSHLDQVLPLFAEALKDEERAPEAAAQFENLLKAAGEKSFEKVLPLLWEGLENKDLEVRVRTAGNLPLAFYFAGPKRTEMLPRLLELAQKYAAINRTLPRTVFYFREDKVLREDSRVLEKNQDWLKDPNPITSQFAQAFKILKENDFKVPKKKNSALIQSLGFSEHFFKNLGRNKPYSEMPPGTRSRALGAAIFDTMSIQPDPLLIFPSLVQVMITVEKIAQRQPVSFQKIQESLETLRNYAAAVTAQSKDPKVKTTVSYALALFVGLAKIFLNPSGLPWPQTLYSLADSIPAGGPGRFYSSAVLKGLQDQKRDLKELVSVFVPQFLALKEELKKTLGEAQTERFLLLNQRRIAKLHLIAPQLSNRVILEYIQDSGLSEAYNWLEVLDYLSWSAAQWTQNILAPLQPTPEQLRQIVSLASSFSEHPADPKKYKKLPKASKDLPYSIQVDEKVLFREIKDPPQNASELIQKLKQVLWTNILKNLNVAEPQKYLSPSKLDGWKPELLPLLTHTPYDLRTGQHFRHPDWLNLIVKFSFLEESFLKAIQFTPTEYPPYDALLEGAIVQRNDHFKRLFEKAGLDYQKWISWEGEHVFEVNLLKSKFHRQKYPRDLKKKIKEILGDFRNRSPGILSWSSSKILFNSVIKKWGLEGDLEQGLSRLAEKGKLEAFLRDFSNSAKEPALKENVDPEKVSLSFSRKLKVRLWKRIPSRDLFQGNCTDNCIAIGFPGKEGIIEDYLLDTSMNIMEVVDEETGRTIAQTFIYLGTNYSGTRQGWWESYYPIFMVLDNIEINANYDPYNREIRDALFHHARSYAQAFGNGKIGKIYMGYLKEENDDRLWDNIPWKDLKWEKVHIAKFGGPLERYSYLDSFWHKSVYHNGDIQTIPLFIVPIEADNVEPSTVSEDKP